MKKIFLPIIAAALSLSANAIPTTFNYQGVVADKDAEVEVTFELRNGNDVVYSQKNLVKTTATGAFTAEIGGGEGWFEVNLADGEYVLATIINGQETVCPLLAVPYAAVAQSYVGQNYIEEDLANLVTANMEKTTEIRALEAKVDNIGENAYMTGVVAQEAYDKVLELEDVVADGLNNTQQDVMGLVEDNMANKAAIAQIQANIDNIDENATMFNEVVDNIIERLDAVEVAADDIQGIQEVLRGKANVDEVAAIADGLNETQTDVMGLVESNMANRAAIGDLTVRVDALTFGHDIKDNVEILNKLYNADEEAAAAIAANKEAIDIVSDDLQGVVERMRNVASVDEVAALKADIENIDENAVKFNEVVETVLERLDAVENVTDDIAGIQEVLRGKANVDEVEAIKANIENIDENAVKFNEVVETVLERLDAVEVATDDIQGIQEKMRGFATVEAVAEVNAQVEQNTVATADNTKNITDLTDAHIGAMKDIKMLSEKLDASLANIDENSAMFNEVIETVLERLDAVEVAADDIQGIQEVLRGKANVDEVATIAEGLDNTQTDVIGLVEDNMANKAAIAQLQAQIANIDDNSEMSAELINTLLEDVDNLKNVTDDIAGIQEKMRGFATVDEVEAIKANIENIDENATMFNEVVENIIERLDAVEAAADDIQGIQEALRNKANVDETMKTADALDKLIVKVQALCVKLGIDYNSLAND